MLMSQYSVINLSCKITVLHTRYKEIACWQGVRGNLRIVGGMFVVFPGNFGKVLWFGSYNVNKKTILSDL